MTEHGFSAHEIDTSRPHPARMYDYYLGGRDNYQVDREAAERVLALVPDALPSARANRRFMERAVRTVVKSGIRQIIDIGSGFPTFPNPHELAWEVAPDVRVAYVDNDPIVATHARARLPNTGNVAFALADAREPRTILDHPVVRDLIDFDEPVALLLVAILHFISDEEDPAGIVATLSEALPEGSHLVLSHGTADFHQHLDGDAADLYQGATARLTVRSHGEILPYFAGYELLEPGLVQVPLWHPDGPLPDVDDLRRVAFYGGVGVKE